MELRVNGESRQESHMSKMSVTVQEVISHYSPMGYSPGDILSLGTVSGVAGFSDDPMSLYLKPGDVVECEIENIGVLRNRSSPARRARRRSRCAGTTRSSPRSGPGSSARRSTPSS